MTWKIIKQKEKEELLKLFLVSMHLKANDEKFINVYMENICLLIERKLWRAAKTCHLIITTMIIKQNFIFFINVNEFVYLSFNWHRKLFVFTLKNEKNHDAN